MTKVVKIEGLDCPNCAKVLESQILKIKSVESVSIDFLKGTISFESENCEKTLKEIVSLAKKVEPNAKIFEPNKRQEKYFSKSVKITGLDCANCAKVLEGEISKLEGIRSVKIDFINSNLTFESLDIEKSFEDILRLAKKIEPSAKIFENKKRENFGSKKSFIIDLTTLFLGLFIGVFTIVYGQRLMDSNVVFFWILFVLSILLLGYKVYYKAFVLLTKKTINENLLITLSVVGATFVGEHMEAIMVVGLYSIGKILEGLAVNKSRKSIAELTNLKPQFAVVLKGKKEEKVFPSEVRSGSVIIVRPGESVPLDGKVIEGNATVDTQSLTGESMPFSVKKNDEVLSGSIVLDGVLKIQTTKEYEDGTVAKIMNLIENAQEKKSKTETFISKMTKWYTLGVICLAVAVFSIVMIFSNNFNMALYRGLIFLVVSCPCAFAISVPLSYFSGIGNASKHGILIKGSNYLDACAKLDVVAFDKTGTLTTGKFSVIDVEVCDKSKTKEDVLYLASVGEQYSLHPLAKSIVLKNTRELKEAQNVVEKAGKGIFYDFEGKKYFAGRKTRNLLKTAVELFENDKKIGVIYLDDTIKNSSVLACKGLKDLKVKTVLLSGDNKNSVLEVAKKIGIDESYGELLPQDKYGFIEKVKKESLYKIGFVGDGINDAPSLVLADVGFGMGINGSSASIEASDIVLVDDNPEKVCSAVKISRYTRKIVWQNILLSALIKILFLTLGAVGVTGMLEAVIADVGVTVCAILNSMRALRYKPQKVHETKIGNCCCEKCKE